MKLLFFAACTILSYICVVEAQSDVHGLVRDYFGRCLDVWNFESENGTPIGAHECHGSTNQQWIISFNDRTFRSLGKCMTAGAAFSVYLHDCNAETRQQWIHSSNNALINLQTNSCLESVPTSNPDVSTLRMAACNGSQDQSWFLP